VYQHVYLTCPTIIVFVKTRISDGGFVFLHLKHDIFTETETDARNVKFNVPINTPDDILRQIGASARIPKIPKVQY